MNLVKLIEDQLSGDVLNPLSSFLGTHTDNTKKAVGAAVPSMLAGLVNLGSSDDGIRKLTSTLSGVDESSFGNIGQMISGNADSLLNKGTSMIGSLFGNNLMNNLAGAIGRFAGLDSGTIQKLLAFLAPLVLGKIATQWRNRGSTPSALSSLLAEQKGHIADSLPAGFSLPSLPSSEAVKDVVRTATNVPRKAVKAAEYATPSVARWLIPLAIVLLGAFLLWNYLKPRDDRETAQTGNPPARVTTLKPEIADASKLAGVTQLTDDLTATFKSMGDTFTNIKDAAAADAAVPKFEEFNLRLDSMKTSIEQLPEAGRVSVKKVFDQHLVPFKEQVKKVLELPGLSEKIRDLINQLMRKLEEWHIA